MTCIVDPGLYPTKKSFKEAVLRDERGVAIEDPSIHEPRMFIPEHIREGELVCVTNHPKRSWFASITRKAGKLVVK